MSAVLNAFIRLRRRLSLLCNKLLTAAFGLDPWHAGTALDRLYPADIIAHLNKRTESERQSAVEIGCGLGDVISALNFKRKTGYDLDGTVLKAAAFKNIFSGHGRTCFLPLDFPKSFLDGKHDSIILVNWIHHLPPDILKSCVTKLYERHLNQDGEIILDTVSDPAYEYNHQIQAITEGLGCSVFQIGAYPRGRSIYALRKTAPQ
ncbi:MAG: hypothetical protein GX410_00625 [Elusimicrobia bacterium]|nr:hypothetical protein [Elusimicrobiota bacterium]